MTGAVYKVLTPGQWSQALALGRFDGAPVDLADGYIHLSTGQQVMETVAKHFRGQGDLVLVRFDARDFGGKLKWEPSRGGALFPHLHDTLDPSLAKAEARLEMQPDGSHRFPEQF